MMRRMETNFLDMILVCALLVANHVSSAASESNSEDYDSPAENDIKQFLNTDKNIWTIITTANDSEECKVDKKQFINSTHLYFSRKHRTRTLTVFTNMYGKFDSQDPPYEIEVGPKGGAPKGVEELIYRGKEDICGVFELRNITNGYSDACDPFDETSCSQYRAYDIRVRGYGGRESARQCLRWFEKMYPEETFQRKLYSGSCNNIGRINWLG
uniref:Lipocalin n=1 Tax=Rhipicephalus appendiculatus TaxID=34631 RepID=A0A131YRV0_RHIAP